MFGQHKLYKPCLWGTRSAVRFPVRGAPFLQGAVPLAPQLCRICAIKILGRDLVGFPSIASHPDVERRAEVSLCIEDDYAGISCPFSEGAVDIVQQARPLPKSQLCWENGAGCKNGIHDRHGAAAAGVSGLQP